MEVGAGAYDKTKKKLLPNTSCVRQLVGVFYRGELVDVEFTVDRAKATASRLSQQDSAARKVIPTLKDYTIREVFVVSTDLNTLFLNQARALLEDAVAKHGDLQASETRRINSAKKEGEKLADHHWQERHSAFLKVESLRRIVSALEEGLNTEKFGLGA